jgi:DUSP domain
MAALNEQSTCRKDKPPGLKYYLVPADWMRLVWHVVLQHTPTPPPMRAAMGDFKNHMYNINNSNSSNNKTENLVAVDWRDQVGPIPTQQLLLTSPDDDVATASSNTSKNGVIRKGSYAQALVSATTKSTTAARASTVATTTANTRLLPGLQHEKDYYLLGSSTWLLLNGKFGTQGPTLVRNVCFHPTTDSSIAVVVSSSSSSSSTSNKNDNNNNKGLLIPIPSTGRFPYESSFRSQPPAGAAAAPSIVEAPAAAAAAAAAEPPPKQQHVYHPPQHPVAAAAAAAAAKHNHQHQPQHHQQQQHHHHHHHHAVVGNVSDDEAEDTVVCLFSVYLSMVKPVRVVGMFATHLRVKNHI